jgi:hypothetical protein
MTKIDNIITLKKLEDFRIKLENGEIKAGCADWVIRMCQAFIAEEYFANRVEWCNILKYQEKARIAFYGGKGSEIITEEYPNGCTLQEAIDFFMEHGEELETIGLI